MNKPFPNPRSFLGFGDQEKWFRNNCIWTESEIACHRSRQVCKGWKENNYANNDDDDNVVLQMRLKTNLISFDIYVDLCITSPIIIIIIIVICEIAT